MLPLDDPRWSDLSHAYGSASDIPQLLGQLAKATTPRQDWQDEPWFSLWSSLCHQGDVYSASYAAVPHIVDIACHAPDPIDFSFFNLPASVEVARNSGRGPDVPPDLIGPYQHAIARPTECVAMHRDATWDQSMLISAFGAQAAAKGHLRIAEAIMNLDDELIEKLIKLEFDE